MAGHVPTLTFDADCTFLEVSPDQRYILEHQSIKRSQLLTEICESATAVGQVRVPVSASALHNWLRHVQPDEVGKRPIIDQEDVDGGIIEAPTAADAVPNVPASMAAAATDAASRSEQRTPDAARLKSSLADTTVANSSLVGCEKCLSDQIGYVEQHCSILQAADLLLDSQTKNEMLAALTTLLLSEMAAPWPDSNATEEEWLPFIQAPVGSQVLTSLSDDLGVALLRAMAPPLPDLIRYLAATPFLPLALRALHPSIDSHSSLHLDSLLMLPPFLSIAILTAPSLGHLTHFSLRDTALAPVAAHLTSALRAFPHLHSLDVSYNNLDAAFPTLAGALASSTTLRTLNLDHTLSSPAALTALAALLPQLTRLEDLSLGAHGGMRHPGVGVRGAAQAALGMSPSMHGEQAAEYRDRQHSALVAATASLPSLPALRILRFTFELDLPVAARAAIGSVFGRLMPLRHLTICDPALCNLIRPPETDTASPSPSVLSSEAEQLQHRRHAAHADSIGAPAPQPLGSGLQSLTWLDFGGGASAATRHGPATTPEAFLHSLPSLASLHEVRMPPLRIQAQHAGVIVSTLGQLTALTRVGIRSVIDSDAGAVYRLLAAVAGLPKVRAVSGPVLCCVESLAGAPDSYESTMAALQTAANDAGAAVRALTGAVACDVPVSVDLSLYVEDDINPANYLDLNFDESLRALLPALHLCTDVSYVSGEHTEGFSILAQAAPSMTAVTRLFIRLESAAYDEVNGPDGPPVDEGLCLGFIGTLGQMTALQQVGFAFPSFVFEPYMDAMVTSLCTELVSLQHLTCLSLEFTIDRGDCIPEVLEACSQMSSLRELELGLHAFPTWDPPTDDASRQEYTTWDVSALADVDLRILAVHDNSPAPSDNCFWESVGKLTSLRCLTLGVAVREEHVSVLACLVKGLPLLEEVCLVGSKGGEEWPPHQVRQVEAAAPGHVRVTTLEGVDRYD